MNETETVPTPETLPEAPPPPPAPKCPSCGTRRGVSPVFALCDDCARRVGWLQYEPADPSSARQLAIAVIRRAVDEVATHVARHGNEYAKETYAADARDFLLRRLWEPHGTLWGDLVSDLLAANMKGRLESYCEGALIRPNSGTLLKRAGQRRVRSTAPLMTEEEDEEP